MAGFEMTEWIDRAPEAVFDFLADTSNAPRVLPAGTRVEKLTDGPPGVGTRYRETRRMNSKEHQAELEVTSFEPPERYSVRNVTDGIETVYHYRLSRERDGTRILLAAQVTASGLRKAMVPLVASILKKEDGGHLARLKAAMESHDRN